MKLSVGYSPRRWAKLAADWSRIVLYTVAPHKPRPPRYLSFFISNRCQLKCSFCRRASSENVGEVMDFGLYESVVKQVSELGGCEELNLTSWGEALLHPRVYDMIRIADEAGFFVEVNTNGEAVDPDRVQGIDMLTISVDDGHIGGGQHVDVLAEKLERILSRPKDERPLVFIAQVDSLDPGVAAMVRGLGVDDWSFREIRYFDSRRKSYRGRIVSRCYAPWEDLVVGVTGDVYTCCYGAESNVVGNLLHQSVSDVWWGDTMNSFRYKIICQGYHPVLCSHCYNWGWIE